MSQEAYLEGVLKHTKIKKVTINTHIVSAYFVNGIKENGLSCLVLAAVDDVVGNPFEIRCRIGGFH